jgi:hypothetical protein
VAQRRQTMPPVSRSTSGVAPSTCQTSRRWTASSATVQPGARRPDPPPDPGFERNPGTIVWYGRDGATGPADVVAADEDGIAVVRNAFLHVPLASTP